MSKGNNIAGEFTIGNAANERRARLDHIARPDQPSYEADIVPNGRAAHVGGGVWLARCLECDDYTLTWGHLGWNYDLAMHTRAHGVDVVGVNVGMMA